MKRKVRRLIEAAENLPYVNLAMKRILELSGWRLEEIKKEEQVNG